MARRPTAPKPKQSHRPARGVSRGRLKVPGEEPVAQPPEGGGGGGGGGGGTPAPDWLGIPGLPPEVVSAIDRIFRDGAPDPDVRALAYLRTTDWYKAEYAGIGSLVAKGIVGNEADYRQWKTQAMSTYQQYYGRAATAQEIQGWADQGLTAQRIGQIGAGQAYVNANRAELQYLGGAFGGGQFSEEELRAYGEQQQGYETNLGGTIKSRVDAALARVNRVFQGELGGSAAMQESLGQQRRRKPDISY